ncbi:MAG TPA: hypothetical protein VI197_23850 [Polyangiaceae bacterium]
MKLALVLEQHQRSLATGGLPRNLGDGYLCAHNPFFARIRSEALARGYGFSERDPGGYFGFPLLGLDLVLESRKIPYRDNVTALERLEAARPGFFTLAELSSNRPSPNYVLHEAAHAVAYAVAFGSRPVREAFADPGHLPWVLAGEAFAMAAEYLAACCVGGSLHRWFFSINSYRHRTQAKRAIGDLMLELGEVPVVWALLSGFVASNTLRESLKEREVCALLEHVPPHTLPQRRQLSALRRAVSEAIKMSRAFRVDTARLFLCKFGYSRRIERQLQFDCVQQIERDPHFRGTLRRLVDVLVVAPAREPAQATRAAQSSLPYAETGAEA